MSERTVLPPRRTGELSDLLSTLRNPSGQAQPALLARDGSRIELPDELFEVLQDVAAALSQGMAITVAPQHTVLSTREAAELLGVSRPTVVRLLESGEIPYEQPGRHRRLRLADVLVYQQRQRRSRAAGLDEMVRESEEDDIYDLPDEATAQRLNDLDGEDQPER